MMKIVRLISVVCASLLSMHITMSEAALLQFIHKWEYLGVTASGHITFDDAVMNNPGTISYSNGGIVAFDITVTGASDGNGTFNLSDFTDVWLNTGGLPLDFTRELIGQPTDDLPWGSDALNGRAGDFNMQAAYGSGAPTGAYFPYFFVIETNGGPGDLLQLVSLGPIPIPQALFLFGSGLLGLFVIARKKTK